MPTSEFDDFVNNLPEREESFDFEKEFVSDSQPEKREEAKDLSDLKSEDSIPFDKNPKIMRFIDRQVKKRINEIAPKREERQMETTNTVDVPQEWLVMYGDSEESRRAWKLQEKILNDYKDLAKQEALETIRLDQEKERKEIAKFQDFIENSLEDIEEQYNVDLTSKSKDAQSRRADFLELVQRLSPKDASGNVITYADFNTAWELFNEKNKSNPQEDSTISRQKNLANRTLQKTSDSIPVKQKGYEPGMGFAGVRRAIGLD